MVITFVSISSLHICLPARVVARCWLLLFVCSGGGGGDVVAAAAAAAAAAAERGGDMTCVRACVRTYEQVMLYIFDDAQMIAY